MRGATVTIAVIRRVVSTVTGDETSRTTSNIDGCHVFPTLTGTEGSTFDSDTVTGDAIAVAPIGSDVLVTDQVEISGTTYEVRGSPYELASPFTGTDRGLAIPLRTMTG